MTPEQSPSSSPVTDAHVVGVETVLHSKVTGADSMNDTLGRFGVAGTDLGLMWDAGAGPDGRPRVFVMFGDTYGSEWGGHGAGPKSADWRTNVLFASTTRDLAAEGMRLESALTRVRRGGAAQAIRRNRLNIPALPFPEQTLIPNTGITIDGVHYVQWMSVAQWMQGGRWRTLQAGIAMSADDGRTWAKPVRGRWLNPLGRDRFQIGAFARDDAWVYLFGTTNGRHGPAYLARVAPAEVTHARAYEYWDGVRWQPRQRRAVPVIEGSTGELSVAYHAGLGRWLAMHFDEPRAAIVLHSAETVTGPWTAGVEIVTGQQYPGLYGGFLHPWFLTGDHIYWLMSQWGPYNVFLMRTTLRAGVAD